MRLVMLALLTAGCGSESSALKQSPAVTDADSTSATSTETDESTDTMDEQAEFLSLTGELVFVDDAPSSASSLVVSLWGSDLEAPLCSRRLSVVTAEVEPPSDPAWSLWNLTLQPFTQPQSTGDTGTTGDTGAVDTALDTGVPGDTSALDTALTTAHTAGTGDTSQPPVDSGLPTTPDCPAPTSIVLGMGPYDARLAPGLVPHAWDSSGLNGLYTQFNGSLQSIGFIAPSSTFGEVGTPLADGELPSGSFALHTAILVTIN